MSSTELQERDKPKDESSEVSSSTDATNSNEEDPNKEAERPIAPPPGKSTDLFQKEGYKYALRRSIKSPYLLANLIYLLYTIMLICIDLYAEVLETTEVNDLYLSANLIHLVNAVMYIWVWKHEGFPLLNVVNIPEVFNITEALLYIVSSVLYRYEYLEYPDLSNSTISEFVPEFAPEILEDIYLEDPYVIIVQNIEITASLIALCAAFGWAVTWYLTFPRFPGRGWTLDDPDVWANSTIIAASIMYTTYNCQIINDRSQYGTNYLYADADYVFFVSALFYVTCALRDAGWFYKLPTAGSFKFYQKWQPKNKKEEKNE